jgi:hypothetical protein
MLSQRRESVAPTRQKTTAHQLSLPTLTETEVTANGKKDSGPPPDFQLGGMPAPPVRV